MLSAKAFVFAIVVGLGAGIAVAYVQGMTVGAATTVLTFVFGMIIYEKTLGKLEDTDD